MAVSQFKTVVFSLLAGASTLVLTTLASDAMAAPAGNTASPIESSIPGFDMVQKVADFGENAAKEALPAAKNAAHTAEDAALEAANSLSSGTAPALPSIGTPSFPSISSGVVPGEEKTNMPSLPTPNLAAPALTLPAIPLPGATGVPLPAPVAPEVAPINIPNPTTTTSAAPPAAGAAGADEKGKENLDSILKEMKILKDNRGNGDADAKPKESVPLPEEYLKMMGADKDDGADEEDPDAKFKTQYLPDTIYRKDYERPNAHLPLSLDGADLERALFETAEQGNINGLRAVLDTKLISPDVRNTYGNTPLMSAALHGKVDTIRLLLAREANPNLQNSLGLTALHIAAQKGRTDVVKALLSMKADPNLKDSYSNTPLMFAAAGKHFATAQALLDGGAVREARFLSEFVQNKSQMKSVKHGKPPGDPAAMGVTPAEANATPDGLVINKPYTPPEPTPPVKPEALTAESATQPPGTLQEGGVLNDLYGVVATPKPQDVGKDPASEEILKAAAAARAAAAAQAAAKPPEVPPAVSAPVETPPLAVPNQAPSIPIAPITIAPAPDVADAPATPALKIPTSLPARSPRKVEPEKEAQSAKPVMPAPSVGLPDEEPAAPIPPIPVKSTAPAAVAPVAEAPALPIKEIKPVTPPAAKPPADLGLPEMPSFDSFVTPAEKPVPPKAPVAPAVQVPDTNELSVPAEGAKKAAVPALTPKSAPKAEAIDPVMDAVGQMFKDAGGDAKKKDEIPAVGPQIPAELE